MLIYLAALPLVLYDSSDWAAVPVTAVIAFLLLGIEVGLRECEWEGSGVQFNQNSGERGIALRMQLS